MSKRSPILNGWNRRLTATPAVMLLALAGLGLGSLAPAQADTADPSTVAFTSPAADITSEVSASTVVETQQLVSGVLAANDASSAWPEVAADLTPKLDDAVAAGGGAAMTTAVGLNFSATINCTITVHIQCTIQIQIGPAKPKPPLMPPVIQPPVLDPIPGQVPPMSPLPPLPPPAPVPSK